MRTLQKLLSLFSAIFSSESSLESYVASKHPTSIHDIETATREYFSARHSLY